MRRSKSRFIEYARRVGTGAVRKPHLPFSRLVGTVSNCAYVVRLETAPTGPGGNTVRLETAPTGPDKSGSKPRGEGVYLFLEFTIVKIVKK